MLNFSRILNKYKKEKEKAAAADQEPAPSQNTGEPNPIAKIVIPPEENVSNSETDPLYAEGLEKARQIYRFRLTIEKDFTAGLDQVVEKIVSALLLGKQELLCACTQGYPKSETYLYGHAINVCILTAEMGIGLGLERNRLAVLSTGAFLHDIGLIKYFDIINKPDMLSPQEHSMINTHPFAGVETLKKSVAHIDPGILTIVEQAHERMDGSGYPRGLKGATINEDAQLVGLAETYETMIHTRPWREKFTPLETIKQLLGDKEKFEPRLVKVLIQRVGIFPAGTLVQMNTKEIGMVVSVNPESPMSPVVNVLFDASGKELSPPKHVNLADNRGVIYIEDSVKS